MENHQTVFHVSISCLVQPNAWWYLKGHFTQIEKKRNTPHFSLLLAISNHIKSICVTWNMFSLRFLLPRQYNGNTFNIKQRKAKNYHNCAIVSEYLEFHRIHRMWLSFAVWLIPWAMNHFSHSFISSSVEKWVARKCCCKCHLIVCLCVRAQSPSLSRRSSQRCLRSWSWRRASGSTLKSSPTRCERVACVRACVRFVHMCGFFLHAAKHLVIHSHL